MKPKGKHTERTPEQSAEAYDPARGYLIRLPNDEAHLRAVEVFFDVREPRHSFPDRQMLVSGAHVRALIQAGVPFEDITEPPKTNGKKKAGKTTSL
ncbi:MAG: hypothetical protein L0Z62_17890 [Gemmataceae bacterium]|nr:hypothetical protein [Gemmataceae bacterium]